MPLDRHRRRPSPSYANGKDAPWQPGDQHEPYTRDQLVRFDDRFRARLLRAFETGAESRQAAAATLGANASRPL
jgi:hypothetical protein